MSQTSSNGDLLWNEPLLLSDTEENNIVIQEALKLEQALYD